MATDSEKPVSRNPESENPKKTLNPPNINLSGESKDPSSAALEKPQSQSDDSTPDEGTDKEVHDSSVKGTNSVVSPTADGGGGADNDIQKKLRRAERFGVPVQLSEEEKRNSRAERFGTVSGSEVSKTSEEQKRKARAERFGLSVASDDEAKKKARLARFGSEAKIDAQEEEKRKARAIRFSQAGSNNVPHKNYEGDVGQKTASAGDDNGGS